MRSFTGWLRKPADEPMRAEIEQHPALAAVGLGAPAMLAAWIPAGAAARVGPQETLRAE